VVTGSNIIGIYPGQNYGTHQDKLVLVGAHWDTVGPTNFTEFVVFSCIDASVLF
jgi:hypothetical protein